MMWKLVLPCLMFGLMFGKLALCAPYGGGGGNGSSGSPPPASPYGQYGGQGGQVPQQKNGAGSPSDTSGLSQQERQFASQLSDMHRAIFCRFFSPSQRVEAMTLASLGAQGGRKGGKSLTPDEAVEVVLRNARQQSLSSGGGQGGQVLAPSPYGQSLYGGNGGSGNNGDGSGNGMDGGGDDGGSGDHGSDDSSSSGDHGSNGSDDNDPYADY